MFSKISLAGTGMYVFAIAFIFNQAGVDIDIDTLQTGVTNVVGTLAFFAWIWGQFRRTDLYLGFFRK